MATTKALTLAALAVISTAASASAADLLPPPPPPAIPVAAPLDTSGWYIRADMGVGVQYQDKLRSSFDTDVPGFAVDRHEIGDAAIIGAGFGYQFNSFLRADVTGEYRSRAAIRTVESYDGFAAYGATCSNFDGGRCPDLYHGSIASSVFLANGYVDLGTWLGVTPFVGAGVGAAIHSVGFTTDNAIGNTGGGYNHPTTQVNFAWAAMAGLGFNATQNLKLEFSYRYLNMGTVKGSPIVCQPIGACDSANERQSYRLASNDFRIGLRYAFASPAPVAVAAPAFYAPPPGPLVRKY